MLLVFDVGNTNMVLGIYENNELTKHWRICTDKEKTSDEYGMLIKNLFEYDKNTIKFSGCHINEEYIYLYAYILWRIWDDKFKYSQCDELTAIEIAELNYGDIFGWTSINEYNVLDIMASKELIRMNRQLEPYTVRRLVSEDFLLNRMYCDLL